MSGVITGTACVTVAKMNENPFLPWLNVVLEEAVRRMRKDAEIQCLTVDETTMIVRLVVEAEVD